jgi:hypothetical protein
MADLLERLEQRAAPAVANPRRGQNYNFPLAWYRRPDGDVVQLQSDPNNRTFYEDLGFVMLRPPEVNEWLDVVRPEVIAEQKKRAQLISAIRRLEHTIPQLIIEDDQQVEFGTMPIDDLNSYYAELCEQYGVKRRLPPTKPEPTGAQHDAMLRGVETSGSIEELDAKLRRGQGYDPLREARRRGSS